MRKYQWYTIVIISILLIGVLTGCSQIGIIQGTGNISEQKYDFSNFTEIEIGHAFTFDIAPSDSYSVSVNTSDNIFESILISQSGSTLTVGLTPATLITVSPKVTITLPNLNRLHLSGASKGKAAGFKGIEYFHLLESGASSLELDIEASRTQMELSGASNIKGRLGTVDSTIRISGASQVNLSGSADNLNVEASSASRANFPDFPIQNATIKLSGASSGNINVAQHLDVDLSGASTLNYSGNPVIGQQSITGSSSLNHK